MAGAGIADRIASATIAAAGRRPHRSRHRLPVAARCRGSLL